MKGAQGRGWWKIVKGRGKRLKKIGGISRRRKHFEKKETLQFIPKQIELTYVSIKMIKF